MASDKQIQKAGDNSQQFQAENVNFTIIHGIDEKRVREVFSEMSVKAIKEYSDEAASKAEKRIKKLADFLIPRMEKLEDGFSAFSDPAFQFLLRKAQIAAACSNKEDDYRLLSELLCQRTCVLENRKESAAISKAVEIVNEIDEEALCILTVYYLLTNYYPTIGKLADGLSYLNDVIGTLLQEKKLPKNLNIFERFSYGEEIVKHLEILNIIRDDRTAERCKRLTDIFDGYVCLGIKDDTENYKKAIEILKSNGLSLKLLITHELLEGYSRLEISNSEMLNLKSWQQDYFARSLSEREENALNEILKLYEKDKLLSFEVKKAFEKEFEKYDNLKRAKELCDILIPYSYITSIGEVIAKANLDRLL